MIYLLILHFIIGSFLAGAFYEYNNRDRGWDDISIYIGTILLGGGLLVLLAIEGLYRICKTVLKKIK